MQTERLKYNAYEKEILEEGYHGNPQLECLRGFSERMSNLAPFVCLVGKLKNLQKYPELDIFSLGVGVMLFVLENMLIGREECSLDEISEFLQSQIYRLYNQHMTQEDARELAFYIRDALTGSGENYQFQYMNLENGQIENIAVRLLDVSYYEIKKTSKYKLTDQGMELLFKTREIFTEFRLNVTQLYLRQQIEKGVFVGALQTLNELNLQVRQLRERIEGMLEGIRQNVFGVKFEDLKMLLEKIQDQFTLERREFTNIKHILGEQKRSLEMMDTNKMTEKDSRAIRLIQVISERIGVVSKEHDRLFNEKIDIIGEYLRMLEYMMKAGITDFLDYERMVFDKLSYNNAPIEAAGYMMKSLFSNQNSNKSFNIFKALSPQKIRQDDSDTEEMLNLEEELEHQEREQKEYEERRNAKIEAYLKRILMTVYEKGGTTVKQVVESYDEEDYNQVSTDFDFYSLLIMLHQKQELDMEEIAGIGQSMVYDSSYNIDLEFLISRILEKNKDLNGLGRLCISAERGSVIFKNGNQMTDFKIARTD